MLLLLLLFLAANALAFRHARAFTHYAESGEDTEDPEDLSFEDKARILLTGPVMTRPENRRRPPFWYGYKTHTFPSSGGIELEAWHLPRNGAPALVVMFHGYGTAKASMLDEAKALRSLGCSVLMVDLRGSGGSTGSVTTLGYREADDVAAAAAYARRLEPESPLIIYGSSMGAVAVLRAMARRNVRPDGAILECPFDSMLSTVKNRFKMLGAPAFPAAHLLVFWGGLQFGFNGFRHDATEYAADVEVPVLLIGGDRDRRVTVDQLEDVYAGLAGPKRLEIFEGAGHGGYVDRDGRRWRRAVRAFLEACLESSASAA